MSAVGVWLVRVVLPVLTLLSEDKRLGPPCSIKRITVTWVIETILYLAVGLIPILTYLPGIGIYMLVGIDCLIAALINLLGLLIISLISKR